MALKQSDILYEDNHLIAVNKEPGILVQGDITGDEPLVDLVKDFLKVKYDKPGNVFAGLVHRIDRPVSGIVLFAKTSKALERMNRLFHQREVEKLYLAIVGDTIESEGELDHWISKDERINKASIHLVEKQGSKSAKLSYKLLAQNKGESLLEIKPLTGRAHQIRAQMAFIGAPIKGDLKYGYPKPNSDKSICLHAFKLEFEHPVQKNKIIIEAPVPAIAEWKGFVPFSADFNK
jgi:23S rRNA pseudouridine1911/1915/1917 synthase